MAYYEFIWTDENIEHIGDNFVTTQEAEDVTSDPEFTKPGKNKTLNAFGYTAAGRYLKVVYVPVDFITIYVITAFEPPERD